MTTHAKVKRPKRSVPRPLIRNGMAKTATTMGAPNPRKFQMVFLAIERLLLAWVSIVENQKLD